MTDWWLTYWISESGSASQDNDSSSANLTFYLGIYGGLAASNSVCGQSVAKWHSNYSYLLAQIFTLIRAFLYAYGGICAAKVLHQKLLNSILMAPTSFFDTTPVSRLLYWWLQVWLVNFLQIGRIVNRFSSDVVSQLLSCLYACTMIALGIV